MELTLKTPKLETIGKATCEDYGNAMRGFASTIAYIAAAVILVTDLAKEYAISGNEMHKQFSEWFEKFTNELNDSHEGWVGNPFDESIVEPALAIATPAGVVTSEASEAFAARMNDFQFEVIEPLAVETEVIQAQPAPELKAPKRIRVKKVKRASTVRKSEMPKGFGN